MDGRRAGHLTSTLTPLPWPSVDVRLDYVIYSLWAVFWLAWLVAALTAKRAAQSGMGQFVGFRLAIL